ncbi:hypothetical protein NPX13_g3290 [Xylaria arbuscula]|uniref:Uncharacterized protein n=1 Tax=Xylaria arbuscula TaxID=114810 RepID=A0A9W8NHK7_9PEZI|nr:hypothetical protein NPX13_g3290 [Xylaria arbuscula]
MRGLVSQDHVAASLGAITAIILNGVLGHVFDDVVLQRFIQWNGEHETGVLLLGLTRTLTHDYRHDYLRSLYQPFN